MPNQEMQAGARSVELSMTRRPGAPSSLAVTRVLRARRRSLSRRRIAREPRSPSVSGRLGSRLPRRPSPREGGAARGGIPIGESSFSQRRRRGARVFEEHGFHRRGDADHVQVRDAPAGEVPNLPDAVRGPGEAHALRALRGHQPPPRARCVMRRALWIHHIHRGSNRSIVLVPPPSRLRRSRVPLARRRPNPNPNPNPPTLTPQP